MTRNSVRKNKARIAELAADAGSFGKSPLQSWIGKVVPFAAQSQQAKTGGWGWRYKVRIMGDHSDNDNIPDEELDYAYVLLPTTAGSGGGGRIRTPRIAQGDVVYGVYGSGDSTGIRLIIGVFPRTESIVYGKVVGKFAPQSGFGFGDIKPSPITGENEVNQANASTPNNVPTTNNSNRVSSAPRLGEMGISSTQTDGPKANAFIPPPKTSATQEWVPGTPITSQQLDYMIETDNALVHDAYDQAIDQGIRSAPERDDDLDNTRQWLVESFRMDRIMEGEENQNSSDLTE